MRDFPFPATEEKERAAGEGKQCERQLGGRGQLLQLGFVHRSSMWCSPSCWGQLHRHSGEVCQGNMSLLISKGMWQIFCVCLSARHKATGQGNLFSWTDINITKNILSFVNGHFTQSNMPEMIRKEKLGSVHLLPEPPEASPYLIRRTISPLPLLIHCPHLVSWLLIKKLFWNKSLTLNTNSSGFPVWSRVLESHSKKVKATHNTLRAHALNVPQSCVGQQR